MNLFKVVYVQAKTIKGTWSSDHGGGGRVKFAGAKKRLDNGKEVNTLVSSAMSKAMEMNNKSKTKDSFESEDKKEAEHFNFNHSRSE